MIPGLEQPKVLLNKLRRRSIDQDPEGSSSSSSIVNREPAPLLFPNLPIELIIEILSRLPAKSLGKFKCVSKNWLSILSSEGFIKTHIAAASGRDDFGHHGLSFTMLSADGYLRHEVLHSVSSLFYGASSETATPKVFGIDFLVKHGKPFWSVGSCNGLLCITTRNDELFLCNPCTKQIRKLPETGMNKGNCYAVFGFGYDKLNDDYKVVGLFQIWGDLLDGTFSIGYEVKVFSLRNNLWRGLEDLKNVVGGICWGVYYLQYASGNLHLCVPTGSGLKIASFDLANETYGEMEPPLKSEGITYADGLGVLGDRLSMFYDYERTRADIWVMNDSWTKVASIPYVVPTDEFSSFGSQLVCSLRNGDIVFLVGAYFLLHNPKTNTSRIYPQIDRIMGVMLYVQSLVSPDIYGV